MRVKALLAGFLSLLSWSLGTIARAQDAAPASPTLKLTVKADYLALRITGTTNITANAWQWRVLPGGPEDMVAWSHFDLPVADGAFKLATPMPAGGWYCVEVRALDGEKVIKEAGVTRPEPAAFVHVTPDRIESLPESERVAWKAYLARSRENEHADHETLATECREIRAAASKPAPTDSERFVCPTKVAASYFASPEAATLASVILSYQTPAGAWSKAVDYSKGARPRGTHWTTQSEAGWHYCGTLDNYSTTEQIKFLALVDQATKREDCRAGALRGLEWLLAAQFPNGGWPQVYPLESGYHEAITLNDDAMLHALDLLLAVRAGEEPFGFCDEALRKRAGAAYERGIQCVLACQVQVQGKRTVWCAQHHPITLTPVAARLKEPVSLSGAESANLLKFLMRDGPTTDAVLSSVEDAIVWLDAHRITNLRKTTNAAGKTDYVKDPASTEVLWARFYDVETGEPIFAGGQDGVVYKTYHDMAEHNKVTYDYFTTKPGDIVGKERERWKKRLEKVGKR
ncbi:PelA/Pel-15E family pectate lyase [Roseimicrobium gellanilyticum]|uniref:PelA/Pel-15E family pectate lyase n=2 Tax=Roseimicrobium gellanilyticum TaxID=748857 RepID=A0A366HBE9_9BACT|nr:PelA/Pel-15E family pectate lyase [Roseimicrobium gellanilyticum]